MSELSGSEAVPLGKLDQLACRIRTRTEYENDWHRRRALLVNGLKTDAWWRYVLLAHRTADVDHNRSVDPVYAEAAQQH